MEVKEAVAEICIFSKKGIITLKNGMSTIEILQFLLKKKVSFSIRYDDELEPSINISDSVFEPLCNMFKEDGIEFYHEY